MSRMTPRMLLSAAIIASACFLSAMVWNVYSTQQQSNHTIITAANLERLRGAIIHLDELLTMSARMAVNTGNPKWEQRYNEYEPQLEQKINEALTLAREVQIPDSAARTREANMKLVAMEMDAFHLVREGKLIAAKHLLSSKRYELQKQNYAQGMADLSQSLSDYAQQVLSENRQRNIRSMMFAFIVVMLLLSIWLWVYRNVRNYQRWQTNIIHDGEAKLSVIFETATTAIILFDANGRIESLNHAAKETFGYPEGESIGKPISQLIPSDFMKGYEHSLESFYKSGQGNVLFHNHELIGLHKSGDIFPIELSVSQVNLEGKQVFTAFTNNISERKVAEDALIAAKDKAEIASRAKSDFLATMSHEIRTPMNGVIGNTSLLMEMPLNEEEREIVDSIRISGECLLSVINDILDFSKVEAGEMELEEQVFDLSGTIEDVLELFATQANKKHIELAECVDETLPQCIISDETRLRQILVNLVGNAMKFTEQGEIVVAVRKLYSKDDALELEFSIKDTGIGIAKDKISRLFQPFSQADSSTTRRYGGTGLGLTISKRLVELLGGRIWLESEPGRGTTFIFTMRAMVAETPSRLELHGNTENLQQKHILIVDDNHTNLHILSRQCEQFGMASTAVSSAQEALILLQGGEHYDIAALDYMMPKMDGLQLAQKIHELKLEPPIPLVVLSSADFSNATRKKAEHYFYSVMTKPVKRSSLLRVFSNAIAHATPVTGEPLFPESHIDTDLAFRYPMTVLVAEDNPTNLMIAVRMLKKLGYHADVAANGLEAVDAVHRQHYDVVLMDIQMPEMNGIEACQKIRFDTDLSEQPLIVAMTANVFAEDQSSCKEVGMEKFLAKPVTLEDMHHMLLECGQELSSPKRLH